ncbi:PHP domain-containing protein [Clostridium sp. A1-XYC3]|uniref:PHP domain-containing protein n=1 Tax=Clostridium tanneri TaxID=3037988 RepID=A0ABU4JTE3_9CLOT|nr:CpsB/CapC family capsule biosynthesis tyrosine phosphatase [Clostridium sp. A1-XYC3]MDW8801416.1 PHP domain-containing protein [Clostridium sp. A1-XYC3]
MNLNSIDLMDLHNHTIWSDGSHTADIIIKNAVKNGMTAVGISDHFNTSKCNSLQNHQLKEYIENINQLKDSYRHDIQVYAGIELSMDTELCDIKNLPYDELNKLDYVLFEYIDCFKNSIKFSELKEYSSKFCCKIGLAHTDLLYYSRIYGLKPLINMLKENNLFWELNVNDGYEYFSKLVRSRDSWRTNRFFKKLKQNNIQISVGSDTHNLQYYDFEQLQIGNLLAKHKSIKMLKYDFSISRAIHLNKGLTNYHI